MTLTTTSPSNVIPLLKVGEAVTSTQLTCTAKRAIITTSQLPESMSDAQRRIAELEAPKAPPPERADMDYGPPVFISQLQVETCNF